MSTAPLSGKLALLVGGGPAPGINGVISSVTIEAIEQGIDVIGFQSWTFPLVVVGMNSIAMYCMSQLMKPWIGSTLKIHFGTTKFARDTGWFDPKYAYSSIMQSAAVLFVMWMVCLWMYRRKLFLKI